MEKSEQQVRSRKRKKIRAVEMMGGKCVICGYNKCIEAMDFHHTEKKNGGKTPSHIIYMYSWERVVEELKKCILVCGNCHREMHANENEKNLDYRKYWRKWLTKSCKRCGEDFDTQIDKMQFCSSLCADISQRKVVRPSKEDLEKLIKDKVPWIRMGKLFGVSDNAVRKWARKYKLIE